MDIEKLIQQIAQAEQQARSTVFLAPCVQGGQIRTRISGLVLSFRPEPEAFEGWGIFLSQDQHTAALVEEASLSQVEAYLNLLKSLSLILISPCRHSTWLAYPAHQESAQRLIAPVRPLLVHLVEQGSRFEQIKVGWDGQTCWFRELDREADPQICEGMQRAFQQQLPAANLRQTGLTPEHRIAYQLASQGIEIVYQLATQAKPQAKPGEETLSEETSIQERLQQALALGGGDLESYRDQGDSWQIRWRTRDGQQHTSAIHKSDLTVIGAGICLSGRDQDFDLQSLVGVVEDADRALTY